MLWTVPFGYDSSSCWIFFIISLISHFLRLVSFFCSELSPQKWDSAPFFHALPKRKKYTYTDKNTVFIRLSQSCEETEGFYIVTMLLGSFTPSRHCLYLGGGLSFPQETKFSLYYSEKLSSLSPFLWYPMTHTWSKSHREPGSTPTLRNKKFWTSLSHHHHSVLVKRMEWLFSSIYMNWATRLQNRTSWSQFWF